MNIRHALRGAAVLSLAVAITGATVLTPNAYAAPTDGSFDLHTVAQKPKTEKSDGKGSSDGSGIGDVPILGDVINQFENAPPEEIIVGAFQFAGAAVEMGAPLIRSLIK